MSRPHGSKSRVILLFLACAALAVFYFINSAHKAKSPSLELSRAQITVGGHNVDAYLAQTEQARENGLGGFDQIGQNQGMLFVFDLASKPSFWMKDMKFPIDIIWINNNQVVDTTKNLPVESGPDLSKYYPNVDVDRVLEVNAGWIDKNDIKVGDKVEMSY